MAPGAAPDIVNRTPCAPAVVGRRMPLRASGCPALASGSPYSRTPLGPPRNAQTRPGHSEFVAHGFAALEGSGAFMNPVDRDESFGWLVDVFLAGLSSKVQARTASTPKAATTRTTTNSASAFGRKAARA